MTEIDRRAVAEKLAGPHKYGCWCNMPERMPEDRCMCARHDHVEAILSALADVEREARAAGREERCEAYHETLAAFVQGKAAGKAEGRREALEEEIARHTPMPKSGWCSACPAIMWPCFSVRRLRSLLQPTTSTSR
jgi:hypothetical protein